MTEEVSGTSLPSAQPVRVGSLPLDSLFSPLDVTDFSSRIPARESIAESEFNEIPLDDDSRLSTSSQSTSASPTTTLSSFKAAEEARRRSTNSICSTPPLDLSKSFSHKKTASTTTIRSTHNLPLTLARLDLQKEGSGSQRGSFDGQKLQDFVRFQKELQEEEASNANAAIDWDFWGAVITDYQGFASTQSERLAKAIEEGIPGTLRGMMWQLMAASKDPELESTYLKLLKETSPHEKAITRDLGRTFPHHDFFTDGQGIGQENLYNVLKAYSLYDPQVGYCQGLPFVVAILLLNMPDEEAFSLLVRLMYSYDLRGHFLPEMPRLQLRLYQFERLIEELLPVLHFHFLRQGVKSSMFCSQWFLTLFSYRFPLEIVFRIYDNCLANGIEAIFGFSIILLMKNEESLLSLKFDEILSFLNNKLFDKYKAETENEGSGMNYKADMFIEDALSLKITPFMLDAYAHEWEEIVRTRDAHAIEVDLLRNSNRNLSAQVKALENSLAQLNAEHVEALNELVMSRLKNEELEEQLVRYKLLYAEAMHENQDALSSHRISIASMLSRRGSSR